MTATKLVRPMALVLLLPLALVAPAPAGAAASSKPTKVVGSLTLTKCDVTARAWCGSIKRPWEPGNPAAGQVKVGFAFVPARTGPAISTLVPHEGGPGYSTTGSTWYYTHMYGPLMDRRNLLLFDQRGTGRSQPIDCPGLQNLKIAYAVAAGRCAKQLGDRADDYTTALSADDLAAVVAALDLGKLDLYGDSYGTFFTQVFAGRHPGQVRSVVLDGAYPTYGESGWYPLQTPAMKRAFDTVCKRAAECRRGGAAFLPTLRKVLRRVRAHPWHGRSHDADGRPMRVTVDGSTLTSVAFGATYGPSFYREFTAAMRSSLHGYRAPLFRLVAEATGGDTDAGAPRDYSEGLDAAVACHDYPQLYDMTASPGTRLVQYDRALTRRTRNHPATYGPFTVREYANSDWQMLDWCLRWPVAPAENPAGTPRPPGHSYPDVPVLILSGELDSITSHEEAKIVQRQFPRTTHVLVRNSFHVTAMGDTDRCASRIARAFIRKPGSEKQVRACAKAVPPVRALGRFPTKVRGLRPSLALVAADVIDRWWNNYAGVGVGLHGGRFSYTGEATVRFKLKNYSLIPGQRVTGTVVWHRGKRTARLDVHVRGRGPDGHVRFTANV
ncbi:MAG: alpha/beta hydrolase [Nocardioidaceae bacterium]